MEIKYIWLFFFYKNAKLFFISFCTFCFTQTWFVQYIYSFVQPSVSCATPSYDNVFLFVFCYAWKFSVCYQSKGTCVCFVMFSFVSAIGFVLIMAKFVTLTGYFSVSISVPLPMLILIHVNIVTCLRCYIVTCNQFYISPFATY